jgi:hypothetical protein
MKLRIDMTGVRAGRLVGVAFSHKSRSGHAHWLFACDCGAETVADGASVRSGNTTSCGCLHREISAARLTVHGRRAGKRHDATYRAWQVMNDHCANPASSGWKRCGGRGVQVCRAWRTDFERFLADMGERPVGAILTRTDPRADFAPGACRWAPLRSRSERALAAIRDRRAEAPRAAA